MQLFISTTSPFARLVLVAAYREKINNLTLSFVNPWENPPELLQANPFSQVPSLLTDNGNLITETPLILNYLTPQIFTDEKQTALISHAITVINHAVRAFGTQRFQPQNTTPHPFIARSTTLLQNALPNIPTLQADSEAWGQIFLGISLVYLQMRLPKIYDTSISIENQQAAVRFNQRDFMQKTATSHLERLQLLAQEVATLKVSLADL